MAPTPSPSSRRPLPQPVEETKRSNRPLPTKNRGEADTTDNGSKPRRGLPQPIDTSSKTSKKAGKDAGSESSRDSTAKPSPSLPQPMESSTSTNKARKFAPQMVETSRRSRRNTADTSPSLTPTEKTDPTLGKPDFLPKHLRPGLNPVPPENSPVVSTDQVPQAPESKFSSAKLAARIPRSHSFRVPNLPVIPSTSEATESNDSESSRSPGADSSDSERTAFRRKKTKSRHASEPRPGQDERYSGYLLSLAARAAEKQLREQAMAAYPNENLHEPVDHYAIESDTEDSDVEEGLGQLSMADDESSEEVQKRRRNRRSHRESTAGWDLAEMRKHQEKLEQQRQDAWAAGEDEQKETGGALPAKQPAKTGGALPPNEIIGWQKDNEMKSMRNAASPPMAGGDLRFPRCQSPRQTRLDVYQYPGQRKPTGTDTRQHSGLWTPGGSRSRRGSQSGLWMGVNAASAQQPSTAHWQSIQTGLLTPNVERTDDPFNSTPSSAGASPSAATTSKTSYLTPSSLPPSPPSSQEESTAANPNVTVQPPGSPTPLPEALDQELDDVFVTQLYNYLSLGYPSLARSYDEELAKISQMSLETIRKDDESGNSKGYIGAPEGTTGLDMRGCREGKCQRWLALRIYVKEWARQQVILRGAEAVVGWSVPAGGIHGRDGGWGAAARKGSWAI